MGAWRGIMHVVTATVTSAPELEAMRKLAWEGVYHQGDVEEVLEGVREDEPLHVLARRGGPVVSRFEAMRRELPRPESGEPRDWARELDELFAYHAMLLACSLDLLAVSWRSERLRAQQARVGPLGPPGERLRGLAQRLSAACG
jgi:hypothetical protein